MLVLDSNIFIQPANSFYGFDLAPPYWDFLAQNHTYQSIDHVYNELVEPAGDDPLKKWAQENRHLFVDSSGSQAEFAHVVNYVMNHPTYSQASKGKFMAKADPWLISHAMRSSGTLVTQESKVDAQSKKVKIPNICEQFNIPCIDIYEFLRSTGFKF